MAPQQNNAHTHNMTSALPTDILFSHILPRLPAKYVSGLKLVAKEWNSFLSSSIFSKLQLHHATNEQNPSQNHHKLLFFSAQTTTPCEYHTIDCEALEVNSLSASRSLAFSSLSSEYITFLSSCNGLVCVGVTTNGRKSYYSDMVLWNPLTGEYNALCRPPDSYKESYTVTESALSVLYYTDSEDTYKLLRVTRNRDVYIYSLLSNSWTKVKSSEELKRRRYDAWGASIVLNGKVYVINEEVRSENQVDRCYYSIIRFDLRTEEFKVIANPRFGDQTKVCLSSMLLQKDGKLHLCVVYKLCEANFTKLWRMDGDGDGDWTEVVTYAVPKDKYSLKPLHLMKNGNWLTVCRAGCHVNERDPVMDFKISSCVDTGNKIDVQKKGIYIETLVSPNSKMK